MASASVAFISLAVQGARIFEPHSASAVKFNVDEKFVPLREILLEPGDASFVSAVVGGHRAIVEGGFVLQVANKTDDLIELKSTTRFTVSTVEDEDEDEWFETNNAECDAAPVAAGLRFATCDDSDGDVHFGTTASCDAHTAGGVSTDATGGAAVDTDPPIAPTSASPFGARSCFALVNLRAARHRGPSCSRFGRHFRCG